MGFQEGMSLALGQIEDVLASSISRLLLLANL